MRQDDEGARRAGRPPPREARRTPSLGGDRHRVIAAFLATQGLARLWGATGPSEEALAVMQAGGGRLSHGEFLMLRIAFELWTREGRVTIAEALGGLDGRNLDAFVLAISELGVDAVR